MHRLPYEFYHRPCIDVARDLVGKLLVRRTEQGEIRLRISETEVYWGKTTPPAMHPKAAPNAPRCFIWTRAPSMFIFAMVCTG